MWLYVMLCYVMLCYVMLCYVMLCYVLLCYVHNIRPMTRYNTKNGSVSEQCISAALVQCIIIKQCIYKEP